MESRAFIRSAQVLMDKIVQGTEGNLQAYELQALGEELQKEVNQLFAGLSNPTLPSAYRLRDTALAAGLSVDGRVLQRLSQFEFLS